MKKYILALVVLCVTDGFAGRQYEARPDLQQGRVTAAYEIQTADGPAYIVCYETEANVSPRELPGLYSSITNFFPDSATIALLALGGYLLGGRKR